MTETAALAAEATDYTGEYVQAGSISNGGVP